MTLDELVDALDEYFRVTEVRGDSRWYESVEPYWREFVEPGWLDRRNGLMVRGAPAVERAVTCVFPSESIVASLEAGTLLFSEHPVDLEDEPGFLPLSPAAFTTMRERGVSFYHVHGPLDQHPEVSPSWLLARGLDLAAPEEFFPIVEGIPGGAAAIGESDVSLDALAERLHRLLGRDVPVRVLSRPREGAGRVAVAAGGGAQADILEAARHT